MNFLKKIFKKPSAAEEISLEDLPRWFSRKTEHISASAKDRLKRSFNDLESKKTELENILIKLRKAQLENKNLSTKELQVIEGNRDLYIKKALDLLNSTEFRGEMDYDTLKAFCADFEKEFVDFSKGTARAFYILGHILGDETSRIAKCLSDMEATEKSMMLVIEDKKGLKMLKELQQDVFELNRMRMLREKLTSQLAEENSKLNSQKEYLKKLEKQKDNLENSDECAQLDSLKSAKVRLQKELESSKSAVLDPLCQLEKALRRYQRIDAANAAKIERCIKEPSEVIFEEQDLSVLEIIQLMLSSLESMEPDERRRAKTIEISGRLNEGFIKDSIARNKELLSKMAEIDMKMKQEKITRDLEDVAYKIAHAQSQVKRIEEEEIRKIDAQLSKLDMQKLCARISSRMEDALEIKVTIK